MGKKVCQQFAFILACLMNVRPWFLDDLYVSLASPDMCMGLALVVTSDMYGGLERVSCNIITSLCMLHVWFLLFLGISNFFRLIFYSLNLL